MAGRKSIERRPCSICQRVTPHTVTKSKNGMGETIAEVAQCNDHREWTDGRLDVRDLKSGDWITVRPGTKSA
jgi:hypothetical protein